MKLGFLQNEISGAGTSHALYDYAHYNETILGNKSVILSLEYELPVPWMEERFVKRFGDIVDVDDRDETVKLDAIYHINYGLSEGFDCSVPYFVHAVFNIKEPHGDRFAAVSKWLADGKVPYVPHIVNMRQTEKKSYREMIGIPEDAVVLGRYGSYSTFDIPWVWDVMQKVLGEREDIWFIFANTAVNLGHDRIVYVNELITQLGKSTFINTCDYMLHARQRGETFGLSVAEFAVSGKPVLTWAGSGERAHIEELGDAAIIYCNPEELHSILLELPPKPKPVYGYKSHDPLSVMTKFRKVFLE